MPQSNDSLKQTTAELVNFRHAVRPQERALGLAAGLLVVLVALACGGSAGDVAIVERLPTLTRTPLPTLTPTVKATQLAMVAEPVTSGSSQNHDPAEAAPAEPQMTEAGIAPGAEPLLPDAAPTGPEASTESVPAESVDPAENSSDAPVPAENLPPTSPPTPTATATATEIPSTPTETAIPTETPTPTATPLPQGWVFSGLHAYPAEALNGMAFYGNLMNNTGEPQQLNAFNTTLYDAQGQVIPYQKTIDQWPVRVVPQGGQVPFGVVVPDVRGVADFNFEVQSEPGGDIPREDFEFVDVNPSTEGEQYCLNGRLKNPGGQLQAYLMVTAVLYDGQDQVINYNNAFKSAPKEVVGDETLDVALCVKSRQQEVARYELRAWGL